jgi:hypothetical protein
MMSGQPGFFDLSDRYEALSAAGDPLERLAAVVDFEVFRGPLVAVLTDRGYLAMGGQIIDATVVPDPKRRNTGAEKGGDQGGPHPQGVASQVREDPAEGS